MGVALPNVSTSNFYQFSGKTNTLGAGGKASDTKQFYVGQSGEFNFKINNSFTSVQILDQNSKTVATFSSGSDIADASAKLGPGTYTAVISQQFANSAGRDYGLDISTRKNVLMTAGGGMLTGTARPAEGKDTGIQKHTLNVVQGGEFTANLSLPNTRWVVMDKDGKVKASGDTMSAPVDDIMKKPSFKLDPGQYTLMVVPPTKLAGDTPYNLQFVPKTANVTMPTKERDFDRIMRERDERLAQWASEDAQKGAGTKVTA